MANLAEPKMVSFDRKYKNLDKNKHDLQVIVETEKDKLVIPIHRQFFPELYSFTNRMIKQDSSLSEKFSEMWCRGFELMNMHHQKRNEFNELYGYPEALKDKQYPEPILEIKFSSLEPKFTDKKTKKIYKS